MSKSIEERMHVAIRANRGIRLSADELYDFVTGDEAIMTRIANAAANEGGIEEPGCANESIFRETWRELGRADDCEIVR